MSITAKYRVEIKKITVEPQVNPIEEGLLYREFFLEFGTEPTLINAFATEIYFDLQQKNIHEKKLIDGSILITLELSILPKNTLMNYMENESELGGKNIVHLLSNNRKNVKQVIK
ncbi:MAG: hypothetical protein JHD28_10535 [Bacteroidia bacterium]|nr:hypothetical protein [Bacteroidia bacterium]